MPFVMDGERGQSEGDDSDSDAGDGERAVAVAGGDKDAAERGSGGVAEVKRSLIEGGGEVWGFGGVVDDA